VNEGEGKWDRLPSQLNNPAMAALARLTKLHIAAPVRSSQSLESLSNLRDLTLDFAYDFKPQSIIAAKAAMVTRLECRFMTLVRTSYTH
jgi:hypothetical protein